MAYTYAMSSAEVPVSEIIRMAGGPYRVGRFFGITPQSVCGWDRVPPARVAGVSEMSGIPPHRIRPDVFPPPASDSPEPKGSDGAMAAS